MAECILTTESIAGNVVGSALPAEHTAIYVDGARDVVIERNRVHDAQVWASPQAPSR
ncbi:MAG: hypothetical protein R3C68_09020 [Myxococcota bacterium]